MRYGKPTLVIVLVAAAVLVVLFGRHACGDVTGVVGFAAHLRRLPHWSRLAIPAAAVLAFLLVTWFLAFGRHLALKVVGIAVLAIALAALGFAFGYVDRNLSSMGSGGTAEQKATVARARTVLVHPIPDEPMNILLLGTDASHNSDSQILVRLDPQAKTISMLSLPRDLYTDIPGVGYAKMNAAYADGGVKLAVQTFSQVTGLPINHFIRVNFNGFWKIIDILHGVYLPIDHRYYVPLGAGYKSIDLQPGYQLVLAKQALNFVRYRHDQDGDFTRMVRQQLFLRAVQQQAMRWSGSWTKVVSMVKSISQLTTTDLDSLCQILPVVNMALTLNTSHIYQVHVEGSTPTIGGVDYVAATPGAIAKAVQQFENPKTQATNSSEVRRCFLVSVCDSRGLSLAASRAVACLRAHGYLALTVPGSDEPRSTTLIRAPQSLASVARSLARLLAPARVAFVQDSASARGLVEVALGTRLQLVGAAVAKSVQRSAAGAGRTYHDWSAWRALSRRTSLTLEAPTAWAPGLAYDTAGVPFRAYTVETIDKRHVAAAIAVGTVTGGSWNGTEYWGVQALAWSDPPAIANPSSTRTVGGRTYLLFSQDKKLHMVAWRENGDTYWVINTLDNVLSNHLMMKLAESCRPVDR